MKMVSRKKKAVIGIAAAVFMCLLFLASSSERALRTAVFFRSPKSGITMDFQREPQRERNEKAWAEIYIITENPPKEAATGGELTTWIVYRFGFIHFARYYGEG